MKSWTILGVAAAAALVSPRLEAKPKTAHNKEKNMKSYTVGPVTFNAPDSGIETSDVGQNAYEAALHGATTPTEKGAWVTFVTMSKDELAPIPAASQMPYFKTTFLGTAKPSEKPVTRTFLQKQVTGESQQAKVPRALTLEAYRVDLDDGGALFIGMRRLSSFPAADAEAFFSAVASSLKLK